MNRLPNNKTLLIAEIGGNHEGSFSKAKDLLFSAHEAGADIVKFQSYSGNGLVNKLLRPERHKHFNKFMLTDEEWIRLAKFAVENNIKFSSSIWDTHYLELLDSYICLYKVGSGDLNNFFLLEKFIQTGKPIIISTAMSDLAMIKKVFQFILSVDPNIVEEDRLGILQCSAVYDNPSFHLSNLSVMETLREEFNCLIGYSNHAVGINSSIAAIAMGANIIEFHFSDDKSRSFRDHKLSFDYDDLKNIRIFRDEINAMKGSDEKIVIEDERENLLEFRRGIFPSRDLPTGSKLTIDDLEFLRPEVGISMWDLEKVLGKKVKRNIKKLEALSFDDLE